MQSQCKWFFCSKGGDFRKWSGNRQYVVNWLNDGEEIKDKKESDLRSGKITANNSKCWNQEYYFERGISWNMITSGAAAFREYKSGTIFDISSPTLFLRGGQDFYGYLSYLNSKVSIEILGALSPTVNFVPGVLASFPMPEQTELDATSKLGSSAVELASKDWDSYEVSWGFVGPQILKADSSLIVQEAYSDLRSIWRGKTLELRNIEEENNSFFISAYGLQGELTPEVQLSEITLTCNPSYRYGSEKSEEELEALLLADTMRELVSYAVGCMFGRYSLDKPGLILANQGETLADYLAQVPQPSFPADDDNVIPLLDGDWFPDDITLRFRQFLRVAFGDAHYEDNLAFIEQALNVKGKRNYSLRDYFMGEFYTDHVKRYKKRPIYWLFSSPKGTFSALVYLHRYRADTVSVVLGYLRDFRKKLASRLDYLQQVAINPSSSQSEKTKASKEADAIKKQLIELDDYERDTLYPLATEQVELDLDDGVKVNYLKLGTALKKIPGLEAKED
ncbi:hypothetical protein P38_2382 [Pseudomonas aeruginosa MH38]|nr:BREX-1 system adenine-specific DNA-methyltransferase PglX [Pseudomonas aeruginosa]CDH70654.1 hypothetical protein P38_2382 [Pseudomonas aeruginosa MH38]